MFTRAQAREEGWSDPALARAVRAGRLISVRRGLLALPTVSGERAAAIAAALAVADCAISHRSALSLHGLPIVGRRPRWPELTVPPHGTGSAHQALLHRATLDADDLVEIDGAVVTSAARTVIDVARSRPAIAAVPAIDAALHGGLVTLDDLDDVLCRCWNWPGIARAQRAMRVVDGRAESALESVSRLTFTRLALPAPDLQPRILNDRGVVVARLDFYWDEIGLAGKADGRVKYSDSDVLTHEKDRHELLEDLQLPIFRWGWTQAWQQPLLLRTKFDLARARAEWRDRSGAPRLWSVLPTKPIRPGEDAIT